MKAHFLFAVVLFSVVGCATAPPDTSTKAERYPCGRPTMPGAEILCPQGESVSVILLPSRTNADMRGAD